MKAVARLLTVLLSALMVAVHADAARKPNVVFILADDLGWVDTALYGSRYYHTPNIDTLAKRGMMFTNAYAASPLCSPTRSSILTGQWPARIGITSPVCHLKPVVLEKGLAEKASPVCEALPAQSLTRLKTDYFTLAEALKQAGYVTGHFGKWHLGHEPYDALHHGFDVDVPHWWGPGPPGSYMAPWRFGPEQNIGAGKPGEHLEERMAAEAIRFIKAHKDEPFYLNYWQFSVHAPFNARPDYIEKYRKTVDPDNPQHCPTYAAMVASLDDAVGRLVATLDEQGIADRTIIVFTSDNGGNMYNFVEGALPTSNAPLRGGKASLYEGGTRVPLLVVWPGVVKPQTTSDQIVTTVDWYPTLLDMLELKLQADQQFDGISIVPALHGKKLERDTIFCHFPHGTGSFDGFQPGTWVRRGDWKLIRIYCVNDDHTDRYELYNLAHDIGERNNLAAQLPDKVAELRAVMQQYLDDTEAVIPKPNPAAKQTVDGWFSRGTSSVERSVGRLKIQSTGGDPWVTSKPYVYTTPGPYTVVFSMQSDSRGGASVYWTSTSVKKFAREHRVNFDAQHDGQMHEYKLTLPIEDTIKSLRIDPSSAPGTIMIDRIELRDAKDRLVKGWSFEK